MKIIKHIVLVLAAVVSTVACNKEITEINEADSARAYKGRLTVSAIAGTVGKGDTGTRAHGDYGYDILWDENDKIAVKDASGHQGIFGITDGVGEKVGTFAQSEDDKYVYSGTVTGYYPADMLQEDGSVKWPAVQTYSKVMTAVPMMATATITEGGTVFNFDGLGGVLQLILTVPEGNLPMKSITVSADNLDNPVSLDCTGLTLGAAANTVNISLPAQEYTNMKLSFVASNGTQRDMTANQAVTIKKNVVLKGAYALDGFELKTEADYLYFTAVDGSVSVGMQRSGTVETIGFEYTTDPAGGTWNDFTAGNSVSEVQNMITLKAGETVFIRAKELRQGLNKSGSDYWRFVFSGDTNGRVQAGGNIMSLLDPEVKSTTVGSYAFCHLFDATFDSKKLLSSPKILVTNLAPHCFDRMFYECRALQEPPMLLPAMELAENCYEYMFSGCAALKYAPALPATKLAKKCYYGMFFHCSAITESPYLPATTLPADCYCNMFDSCASLSSVNVNFTDFDGALDATKGWLSGVSSTGVFYCPQEVAPDLSRSSNTIPENWKTFRNVLPDNAYIGTEVYSSGRLGIYVGTLDGHKLLFAKTDVGSEDEYKPGARFSRDELDSPQSWGQGWRLPTVAEMEALYKNFKLDIFEDSAWFSFDKTSTSLLFPYTNNVADGKKESRCWLSGKERFFWFRSDLVGGSTAVSEVASQKFSVRLVKEL